MSVVSIPDAAADIQIEGKLQAHVYIAFFFFFLQGNKAMAVHSGALR